MGISGYLSKSEHLLLGVALGFIIGVALAATQYSAGAKGRSFERLGPDYPSSRSERLFTPLPKQKYKYDI